MTDIDVGKLWSIMDTALQTGGAFPDCIDEDCLDEEDEEDLTETTAVVVPLDNGQFHVCMGSKCPHVRPGTDNEKHFVCNLSGRVVGAAMSSAHDSSWTGRSCGSADPDMASGAVPARAWRNKRDAFAESARAYSNAKQMTDESCFFADYASNEARRVAASKETAQDESKVTAKRGAPCVSEIDETAVTQQKRDKAIRRITSLSRRDVQARLINDSMGVVSKLFAAAPTASSQAAADPRLENHNFVYSIGLRRYIERCVHDNEPVCLSKMHDVAVCASNFVREKRKEAKHRQDVSRARLLAVNTQTTEMFSRLIVSVWNAVCNTPHFVESQPGDSFRPFAAGICYALKRGIRLKNGLVVVPRMELLSDQLPTLRSSSNNAEARQLQASSHRGLCAIHRAIASIDRMNDDDRPGCDRGPVLEKLRVAAQISAALEQFAAKFMAGS